jgi:predicted AAA+ superfamily ATPase
MDNRIHADEFFAENYVTEGMRRLLTHAFRRFRGETDVPMHLTHQEHSLAQ